MWCHILCSSSLFDHSTSHQSWTICQRWPTEGSQVNIPLTNIYLSTEIYWDLLPTTPSKPVIAATSTPPPINWATKPRAQVATTNRQMLSVQLTNSVSTPRRRIPIFIYPDDIGELQEAILHLALSNPTVPTLGDQKEYKIESPPSQLPSKPPTGMADHEEYAFFDGQSLRTSKSGDHSLDSSISTSANLTVSSPPSPLVLSQNSVPLSRKRYYVITVGKCAGIFYGEWYVNLSIDSCSLILTFLFRDNVSHLVLGVSGGKFKGFSTKEKANQAYHSAKNHGKVHIVRNPGDDEKYGPLFYAIQ